MKMNRISFEEVCNYAELRGCPRREGYSKAADHSQTYFYNYWEHKSIMALYEGPKRILRGHDKPEVCWWCIDCYGDLHSVPARHLRLMDKICGFGLTDTAYEQIRKTLNEAELNIIQNEEA